MLEKLLTQRYTIATLWIVFLANGFALFSLGSYPQLKLLFEGKEFPEEIPLADWDYQTEFLKKIGEKGVEMYTTFQYLDFFNAALLGITVAATMYYALHIIEAPKWLNGIWFLPLAGGLADIVENAVMLFNLGGYPPELNKTLSLVYSWVGIAKFTLVSLSFLLLLGIVFLSILMFFRKRAGSGKV